MDDRDNFIDKKPVSFFAETGEGGSPTGTDFSATVQKDNFLGGAAKEPESTEVRKARIDRLWSAWDDVQTKQELVSLFDRQAVLGSDKDPKQILQEHDYPERTQISDLEFEDWTVKIDPKFVKDGHVYLLRGDYPDLDKKGFYSRPYGYGKQTTGHLAGELDSSGDVGYFLYGDERYFNQKPQSKSVAQQLAYQQSAVGASSFISATTNLDAARTGTGNQPDLEEQKKYEVYVVRVPQEYVINSNTGNHFGMKENEYLIPDYITPDEIVAKFPRDDTEGVYQYMHGQLGITREDLGMSIDENKELVDKSEGNFMRKVKERYKEQMAPYEIIPIDENGVNLGFVLRNSEEPPVKGDWVLTDLDDTMIGTQEVKPQREQLFSEYFKGLGLQLSEDQVKHVIKATDKFARWQDTKDGSNDCYHPVAHGVALQQIADALVASKQQGGQDSVDDILAKVFEKFDRIKTQLTGDAQPELGDPFRFTADKKFVIKKIPPWSDEISRIFKQTMVTPPRYDKNIGAFSDSFASGDDDIDGAKIDVVNAGVFTSGVPSYQLNKMGELLRENPDLKFNSMLFTRVGKDRFLRRFIEQEGIRDSVIVMYDDGIGNLEGLERMGQEDHEQTGNTIKGVVARTPYAKDVSSTSGLPTLDHDNMSQNDIRRGLRLALEVRDNIRLETNTS